MTPILFVALLLVALLAGVLLGYLLRGTTKTPDLPGEHAREGYLEQRFRDLTQELGATRAELERKKDIAAQIPIIVKVLSEKLPPRAIPPIAVRAAKDFFRASAAGYFAPVEGGKEFTLVEGVGFPQDWKGTIRIPGDEGILGLALRKHVVVTKDDYAAGVERPLGHLSTFQKAGVEADLAIPVSGEADAQGVIVVAGSTVPVGAERAYASMLSDLLAGAFKAASMIESAEIDASVDPLTGLYNRRYLAQWFENEIRRSKTYSDRLSLLMFDIDHFKKVNDAYGHPAGDQVLRKLAEVVRGFTRSSDLVARYGGEEFVVVMTSTGKDQAFTYGDNLRKKVAAMEMSVPGHGSPIRVTLSGGVAGFPADGESTTDILRAADVALYEAKQAGRNRVVRAEHVGLDGAPIDATGGEHT